MQAGQGLSAMSANNAMAQAYQNQSAMQPMQASSNSIAASGGWGALAAGNRGNAAPVAQNFAPQAAAMAPLPRSVFDMYPAPRGQQVYSSPAGPFPMASPQIAQAQNFTPNNFGYK
jgi:hypothetical protein